jgi:putative MATE family efflux protein
LDLKNIFMFKKETESNLKEENELADSNFLLEGNIARTIYLVAAPTMIQMFLETFYHIIDAFWIGLLGPVALAAVASSSFLLWLIFSWCSLVEVGINSLVARYYGARDFASLIKTGVYGIRFGIFISIIISLIFIPSIARLFEIMGLAPDVTANATCYMIPCLVGLPLYVISSSCYAIFRGVGETKTPLGILLVTLLLNTVLAPLLIFGIWVFPHLGIAGGSIATVISQFISVIISLVLLRRKKLLAKTSKFLEKDFIGKITRIGAPISVNGIIFCVVYLFLTRIISQFGTAPVAALGIGHRVESLGYCISVGFSIAATTLVGQNIGANNEKRANSIAWQITYYSGTVMLLISILILLFRTNISGFFTDDPAVIAAASGYLTAIGFTEVFLAFEIVMEGVFSGKGNTLPFTFVGLPLNILRVPAAYYLSGFFGVDGIWWSIGLSTAFKGFFLLVWFKLSIKSKAVS